MEHLDSMDLLREGVGLRAYGQKDPLVEYKFEAYDMFQAMIDAIQDDVVRYIYRCHRDKDHFVRSFHLLPEAVF